MSLMLHLTKNLHGTAITVVLDCGFFVLQDLVDIKKKGCMGTHPSRRGGTGHNILMEKISSIASPTRVLGI